MIDLKRALGLSLCFASLSPAWAEVPSSGGFLEATDPLVAPIPPVSGPDFSDPLGHSRAHVTARFSPGDRADAHVWSFELLFGLHITAGSAVTVRVPVGLLVPEAQVDNRFFFGNISAGFEAGTAIPLVTGWEGIGAPALILGGSIDLYAPTAPGRPDGCALASITCDGTWWVGQTRTLEPGSYAGKSFPARLRGQVGFELSRFALGLEAGLVPIVPLENDPEVAMILTFGARFRAVLGPVEPYLELAYARNILDPEPGRFAAAPLLLTPGIRVHLGPISPAVFVQIAPDPTLGRVTFGIDFAGIQRRGLRNEGPADDSPFGRSTTF